MTPFASAKVVKPSAATTDAEAPGPRDDGDPGRRSRQGVLVWRRFAANVPALLGLLFLALVVLMAVVPGLFTSHGPNAQDIPTRLQGPSGSHWLGTDELGRDMFARLIYGARLSMAAALLTIVVAVSVGVPSGLIAGYLGGRVDRALSWVFDGLMSIPGIIVVIAVTASFGVGLMKSMIAMGVVFAPRLFRIQRATTMAARHETYVEACESIGCSTWRILWRHIWPNTISPTMVQISIMLGAAVTIEASLSFIGLGVQAPDASWGSLVASGYPFLRDAPHLVIPAGVAITLTVMAFGLVGDGLGDALSSRPSAPRKRRRRA